VSLPRADSGRIAADIDALRARTIPDRPFTRRAFTPMYAEGRRWLIDAMAEAGLRTHCDAAANLIASSGRYVESVAIGSHIDTVPDGGAYDGVAGVLAGLEVARLLRAAAIELPFTLEVIDFLSEEPSDFGISCIGSRALVGRLSSQDLSRRDSRGTRLADAIDAVGGRTAAIGSPMRQHGTLLAYLELHIEQGRRLEQADTPLGIVTGIVGIRRYEVRLRGTAAHSGTTPMNHRRDALAGVAELILSVERLARERSRDGEFVGTVGQLTVVPGGANVVPGETTATVELRALEDRTLDEAELELREDARDQAARRGLELAFDEISRTAPVELDPDLRAVLARAARNAGTDPLELASGGGHDAGHMAAIAPSAMLFIPCRDGVSHAPEEAAEPEHIALGADVLLRVLVELAERRR
jgi:beta-ureidopropionase / N-carbamoyl-L-amino-acid hydrolase